MTSYIVVHVRPKDPEKIKTYSAKAAETIAAHGGTVLFKGVPHDLHGTVDYKMTLILSFPSSDVAHQWYDSESYQQLVNLRDEAMDSVFMLLPA